MDRDIVHLIHFVLDAAQAEPLRRRASIYRGLAKICGEECEVRKLTDLAITLEHSDRLCREFIFSFSEENTEHLQQS